MEIDYNSGLNGSYLKNVIAEVMDQRRGGDQVASVGARAVNTNAPVFGIPPHLGSAPPGTSTKRKSNPVPLAVSRAVDELEVKLQCMRSAMKSAIYEVKTFSGDLPGCTRILRILESVQSTIVELITKKGKLLSPLASPRTKRTKDEVQQEMQVINKPVMVDPETDTVLTPSWWDSDKTIEARASAKKSGLKTRASGPARS